MRLPIGDTSGFSVDPMRNAKNSKVILWTVIQEQMKIAFEEGDITKINEVEYLIKKLQILDNRVNMILLLEKLIRLQASSAVRILSGLIRKI